MAIFQQFRAGLANILIAMALGMLIANLPAVQLADRFAARLPMRLIHRVAAATSAALGLLALLGVEKTFR